MEKQINLHEVQKKYYNKIQKEYAQYVLDFDKKKTLEEDVYIVPDKDCCGSLLDIFTRRGKCDKESGKIYIRESQYSEHVLIHEYIHRLSRNWINNQWILGIGYKYEIYPGKIMDFTGLNEILTEWITYQITQVKEEGNTYQRMFPIMEKIIEMKGEILPEILRQYFSGNHIALLVSILDCFPSSALNVLRETEKLS